MCTPNPMKVGNLSIVRTRVDGYPWQPPFEPGEPFPEYPFGSAGTAENPVYAMVRQTLADLGYDARRFGTADWNPLGEFVSPGQTVVIKPNFVLDYNQEHYGRHSRAPVAEVKNYPTQGSLGFLTSTPKRESQRQDLPCLHQFQDVGKSCLNR